MNWYVFRFRPSSHSDNYTVIATYRSDRVAEKVKEALLKMLEDMRRNPESYDTDWDPDEAAVWRDGNHVMFEVYTAGYLEDVDALLRKVAKPQSIECYVNYQELTICVSVPKGLSVEAAMLVLDRDEAEAVKWLTENCGKPEIEENEKERILKWFYKGDEIYSEGTLYLGALQFPVDERENWSVFGSDE